jgi:phosphopantothenoylcysteine decarboxylase/phosphopantothenate--cysteine ligase
MLRVLLGVSGGIAAYKAAELVRLFRQRGDEVRVVMTRHARRFVTPLTFASLSGEPVLTSLFGPQPAAIEHIAVAQEASIAVVAPATANTLARMAHGVADDYLTTLLLATPAPVLVAPAMNVQMWRHAATLANVELLRSRGVRVVPPGEGELACGMVGEGRMAEPAEIFAAAIALAEPRRDLAGETILITAGPTREPLDPVRYLSNRSSGRMGFALAEAAAGRGARVELVAGPVSISPPAGVHVQPVTTAEEMAAAVLPLFEQCSIAILAAAVADYRPAAASPQKIKKSSAPLRLELEPTRDILAELGRRKRGQLLIGFAAETGVEPGLAHAREKRLRKNADLIVFNDVSRDGIGFEAADNAVTLITASGEAALARAPKSVLAGHILDAIAALPRHALTHA